MDQQLSGSVPELAPTLPVSDAAVARLLRQVLVPQLETGSMRFHLVDTAQAELEVPLPRIPLGSPRVRNGPTGYHAHETPEICWVVDGSCLLWVAGHIVSLDPDSACIVQPGQAHRLHPTPQLTPFRTLWWLATPGGVIVYDSFYAQRRRGVVSRVVSRFVNLEVPIALQLDLLTRELKVQRPYSHLLVCATMLTLTARILRALAETGASDRIPDLRAQKVSWYIRHLTEYIQAHHGAELTLGRLAAVVDLSPSYLATLFRRQMGRTVMAYVNDVRLGEARSLLRNTDLRVAAVARLVGYRDPYYFSRVFRMREGYPPRQYRSLFRSAAAP